MTQHSTRTTPAQRQQEIEAIAQGYGIQPAQLTPAVLFCLGQLQASQMVAISEGCGSGELPDRLRARVAEREAELRRLLDEQEHDVEQGQPSGATDLESAARTLFERHQREFENVSIASVIEVLTRQYDLRVYAEAGGRDDSGNEVESYLVTHSFTAKGLRYAAALARLEDDLLPDEIEPAGPVTIQAA